MFKCESCTEVAPTISTTVWIDLFGTDKPGAERLEIDDIDTDGYELRCANCDAPLYITTQQAADLITRLFRHLFDRHDLNADRIGDTIVVAEPSAVAA